MEKEKIFQDNIRIYELQEMRNNKEAKIIVLVKEEFRSQILEMLTEQKNFRSI